MKETINWRQLYNESQAIRPEDTNISTERIGRLVNIYKNDLIDQDLRQYAQRLTRFSRCCQICTTNSYTAYRWFDTYISGDKNLFDFHLSGRSVSALVYYLNKTILKQSNERGQLSDFQQDNNDDLSISFLSNLDEDIMIKKHFFTSFIPNFIYRLIIKFQMYYTYRKAQSLSLSIQVHNQPMKTFQYLLGTNISPIFICFVNEDNSFRQLFWAFRHLITISNWPSTTKIFSNCSFRTNSIFERMMMNSLGFTDLSGLNINQKDLFCYIYRCLKTCQQNGPIIFLFDNSTIYKPKPLDYYLMSFLCDLIRFGNLSIPDMVFIPTRLNKSYLAFSQPFLFKEMVEFFTKKMNIQKQFCDLIKTKEQTIIYKLIDCIFLHLAYDSNQLTPTAIEFEHILASIELSQISNNQESATVEIIFNTLQMILKTCPFIIADNHKWHEIAVKDIELYKFKFDNNKNSKFKLISIVRKEYFLEILATLSILSKIQHIDNRSRIYEFEMFNQMVFLLFTFGTKEYLNIRSCQNIHQIIQQTIQHCQSRHYILTDYISQKSMKFCDTILSDHEWSDDNDDDVDVMEEEFIDHDDEDDMLITDIPNKIYETTKPIYRINYQETHLQLKFFAKLFGSYIEAIVYILKYHIEKQLKVFTLVEFSFHQGFHFRETSCLDCNEILLLIRRAYGYRLLEHSNILDEIPMFFEPIDDNLYPLSMDNLVSLYDDFVKLLNCCCID
ncbi:unnamed protein product [Adineta steineri]|uniref:Uncharacterized protein n=1 Tax=Adineta steineri TaxID=433720 RepID=A0A819DD13_9BILA|nr:unnamed protein product [Adineta steineri]CAF3832538.1 unnamed protein product [Adineta steineri]